MTSPPKKQFVDGCSPNLSRLSSFRVNNTTVNSFARLSNGHRIVETSYCLSSYLALPKEVIVAPGSPCAAHVPVTSKASTFLSLLLTALRQQLLVATGKLEHFPYSSIVFEVTGPYHRLLPQAEISFSQPNPDWTKSCHGNRLALQVPAKSSSLSSLCVGRQDWAPQHYSAASTV
jgi:hypothetical protein